MKRKKIVFYILSKEINVSLLRKTEVNHYGDLDEKDITDKKNLENC